MRKGKRFVTISVILRILTRPRLFFFLIFTILWLWRTAHCILVEIQTLHFEIICVIFQTGFLSGLLIPPLATVSLCTSAPLIRMKFFLPTTPHLHHICPSIRVLCIASATSSVCAAHIYAKSLLPLYPFLSHPLLKPAFIFKDSSTQPFMCCALNPFIPLSIPSEAFFPWEGGGSSLKSLLRERSLGPIIWLVSQVI